MKIVYMGTPDFAVPCLQALLQQAYEVVGVFTQPDKPKGRGYKMIPPPVKAAAVEAGLSVYQPLSLRKGEEAEQAMQTLQELAPDVIVVVAYGQILPKAVLDLPKYGCINIHGSLLPAYRGAAPMQMCLLNGETETGVTSMQMAEGLDTGDMLVKEALPILADQTFDSLHDRLAELGASVLLETLEKLAAGTLQPERGRDAQVPELCPLPGREGDRPGHLPGHGGAHPQPEHHAFARGKSSRVQFHQLWNRHFSRRPHGHRGTAESYHRRPGYPWRSTGLPHTDIQG